MQQIRSWFYLAVRNKYGYSYLDSQAKVASGERSVIKKTLLNLD